jgi:hypothetical protein
MISSIFIRKYSLKVQIIEMYIFSPSLRTINPIKNRKRKNYSIPIYFQKNVDLLDSKNPLFLSLHEFILEKPQRPSLWKESSIF